MSLAVFAVFASAMVIAQRVSALQQFILSGNQVTIAYSFSSVSQKFKAKIQVAAGADVVPLAARQALLQSLEPLFAISGSGVTVDRGHTYSDGHAIATFWVQPVVSVGAEVIEPPSIPLHAVAPESVDVPSALDPSAAVFVPAHSPDGDDAEDELLSSLAMPVADVTTMVSPAAVPVAEPIVAPPFQVGDIVRVVKPESRYHGYDGTVAEEPFVDGGLSYAAVRHIDGRVREYSIDCIVHAGR